MAGIAGISAVRNALNRLRRTEAAIWAFKYGMPYAFSTLVTLAAAYAVESLRCCDCLAVLVEWLAENGAFYGMAFACGTFSDSDPRVTRPWRRLQRILAAEGLDTVVRSLLLLAARRLPVEYRSCGAAFAGVLADVSFCFVIAYSERLLSWCGWITDAFLPSRDHTVLLPGAAETARNRI